ncbi:hypothetical protein NW766_007646 [Fusarium irregulare]|uniref:Uncharacterized protein n=1 Tax=Fusarium irregulare TaxID=2494466 RepID=A0A9W8PLV9_9HYPO|nr:hypothetical protein NW766_007646 [Fusarium irregulare]
MPGKTHSQHDRIAGLVGRKASEIGVAHGILDTSAKGKKQKLNFKEKVHVQGSGEVMADFVAGFFMLVR